MISDKQKPPASLEARNILAVRLDNIGDLISTLPAFSALHQLTGIKPVVLCQDQYTDLLKGNPDISTVIGHSARHKAATISKIKALAIDLAINFSHVKQSRFFMPRLRFIPHRLGNVNHWSAYLSYNHRIYQNRSKSIKNEAWYCLNMLEHIKLVPTKKQTKLNYHLRPKIYLLASEQKEARDFIKQQNLDHKKLIIMHAGSRGSALNWPQANYIKLASLLVKAGYQLLLTGVSTSEKIFNQQLVAKLSDYSLKVVDSTNKFSLRQLCAIISLARLVIASSTGPLHIANAVNTKLIGLYPPIRTQSATRWSPYLQKGGIIFSPDVSCPAANNCWGEKCPDFYCLNKLTPELLFQAAQTITKNEQSATLQG